MTPIIGEVWYNKDLKNICNFLEKQKINYHFFTNLLILDKEKIQFANTLKYGSVFVSINGTTLDEFNLLNNASLSDEKFIGLIHMIKNSRLIPMIKTKFKNSPISKIIKISKFINNIDNWGGLNKNIYISKNDINCKVLIEKNIIRMNGDFCLCGCRDPYGETKIGNIFNSNLSDILSSPEYSKIPELCKNCTGVDS